MKIRHFGLHCLSSAKQRAKRGLPCLLVSSNDLNVFLSTFARKYIFWLEKNLPPKNRFLNILMIFQYFSEYVFHTDLKITESILKVVLYLWKR